MKQLHSIQIHTGSGEEILPGFASDFPYIATCAELDRYPDFCTPWHWHRTVELFYVPSGCVEYSTPGGSWKFPAGTGGFVNSNVLHTSTSLPQSEPTVQWLHLFDPSLIAGSEGSRMEQRYVRPLLSVGPEIFPLSPEDPQQADILRQIQEAFALEETQWGYELALHSLLSQIWLAVFMLARPRFQPNVDSHYALKQLMGYVHANYSQPISVDALAQSIPISKRSCFRLFQDTLHLTPGEYIRNYRLQKACQMLTQSQESITSIAYQCGLGSSNYFGKVFRESYGCTPLEYRKKWQKAEFVPAETNKSGSYDLFPEEIP